MNRHVAFALSLLLLIGVGILTVMLNRSAKLNSVQTSTIPDDRSATSSDQEAPIVSPAEGKVASPIKKDEEVVFFPTIATPVGLPNESESPRGFDIEIHGCIFEAGKHALGVKLIRELTEIDESKLTIEEARLFQQRAELFAVDHERDKKIPVRLGKQVFVLPPSAANGHFHARIRLDSKVIEAVTDGQFRELNVAAVLRDGDKRRITGRVHLAPVQSSVVRVISDIDDTIKISQVRDKATLMLNTFCRPFRPVPGMANMYREWEKSGARFHYVSASPWQLYPPLAEFLREYEFPAGSFHMKLFRPTDRSVTNLFGSQVDYKRGEIKSLLEKFPHDRFVLVGDSGEQDATIYAKLAREHSRQVSRILIRNVTEEPLDAFRKVFDGLPR